MEIKDDTWSVLSRYKMLEDKINELRAQAILTLPPSDDINEALLEADEELKRLRSWIELNFELKKVD